ncbi:uncharacterized protein PgNI_08484, partial [Pyricularia grisea]|uniref:Carrier domain-containing protein n=1 Tax=Pyricularia grisea TaxID=148305 RepID=A0A6P8AU95_PYRGI
MDTNKLAASDHAGSSHSSLQPTTIGISLELLYQELISWQIREMPTLSLGSRATCDADEYQEVFRDQVPSEPAAASKSIIGLDARFPGDGDSAERFYEFLLAGRSARSEVPPERYNADAFWHPDGNRSGATRTRAAHFLKGSISAFDAPLFSITPTEAAAMDPQQRGILENVYRALENAGVPLEKAAGSQTGVFIGCMYSDYDRMTVKDLERPTTYAALGTVYSMLSNRVSWCFDFRGPSITVDTACSSSLVALHQACNSLKLHESSMAVVGGCNLIISPEFALLLDAAGVLGPDGKSYSFDHRGNGYSRGEGFGVVVLKRLSDALRDGDVIRAVIRNSGTNSDGRSPGITQPTKAAQAALIKQVYANAGLDPSVTRFFEAHGTGTAVGDPIEASAIAEIFATHRSPKSPLWVGALKSNIGHLEGAAGVAAVIKGVLTLENGVIPANTWFERKNPKILDSWHLQFPTEPVVWPQPGLRRMSINSFGVGGSNAHVVMDDALHFLQAYSLVGNHRTVTLPRLPGSSNTRRIVSQGDSGVEFTDSDSEIKTPDGTHSPASTAAPSKDTNFDSSCRNTDTPQITDNTQQPKPLVIACPEVLSKRLSRLTMVDEEQQQQSQLFVFSSSDKDGVSRVMNQLADYLAKKTKQYKSKTRDHPGFLRDLSYTLACKRTRHAWRSFVVAKTQSSLSTMLQEKPLATRAASEPQLAFVFTGQGAQWPAMGISLMIYPAFRESLYQAEEYMTQTLRCSWSLTYELCKESGASRINDAEFSQPICTALQMALVDLLRTWKVKPHAVVGHSSGEIAAAYAAGQLSRQSAWRIAYYRGKLSTKLIRSLKPLDKSQSTHMQKTGMVAVGLNRDQTLAAINRIDSLMSEGSLEIACMNSQESHTLSGDMAKLDALVELLKSEKVFARKLAVEIGYHSKHMLPIRDEYVQLIGDIGSDLQPSQGIGLPRYFSSLEGTEVPLDRLRIADYWANNLISPVRFHEAVKLMLHADLGSGSQGESSTLDKKTVTDLLEIGPHAALRGPLRSIIQQVHQTAEGKIGYATVLKRGDAAIESAIEAAGSLFCRGFDLDLAAVNQHHVASSRQIIPQNGGNSVLMLTDLPGYPFNHKKEYWAESRLSRNYRFRSAPRHELLGAPVPDWDRNDAVWRNYIRVSENPWVEDHKVSREILYPAAGMLVMAIEASRQLADKDKQVSGFRFKDVSFHLALIIPTDDLGVETRFRLRYLSEGKLAGWSEFQLCTSENDDWKEHCRGFVWTEYAQTGSSANVEPSLLVRRQCEEEIEQAKKTCRSRVYADKVYRKLANIGLDFGTTFRTLKDVKFDGTSRILARAESQVSHIKKSMPREYLHPHLVHPSMLDAVLQANLIPLVLGSASTDSLVPVFASDLWVSAATKEGVDFHNSAYLISSHAKLTPGTADAEASFFGIHADTGEPLVTSSGLAFKAIPNNASSGQRDHHRPALNLDWKPDPNYLTEEDALRTFGATAIAQSSNEVSGDESDCEALCLLYIRRFLALLEDTVVKKLDWHHLRYVSWMRHVLQTTAVVPPTDDISAMEARVAATGTPEGKLIMAVGRNLANMLVTGDVDPLDVIFGDKVAENVYREGLGSRRCYAQMCAYLDALAHVNPSMNILEVGGGTGGATGSIMETLMANGARRFDHYDFTDISPSFFEHAKETFKDAADHMSFRVLNIEKEPTDQGYEHQSYDLVLAANVLHATKSMDRTLAHVRKLLKPGGKLIVFELTNPAVLLGGFCFGVLPGWWLSEEADREWGPLMVVDTWRAYLERAGFSGVDAVFHDFHDAAHQTSSILVSTALPAIDAQDPVNGVAKLTRYCVLMDERPSELQRQVADMLLPVLARTGSVETSTIPGSVGRNLKDSCCIVITELDSPTLLDMTAEVFTALQGVLSICKSIFWLSRGGNNLVAAPDRELVTGLARVVRTERGPPFSFVTVSFAEVESAETIVDKTLQVLDRSQDTAENSFRVSNGVVHVPRLVEATYLTDHVGTEAQPTSAQAVTREVKLGDVRRELLSRIQSHGSVQGAGTVDFCFAEDHSGERPLADDEVEFKVMACGVSVHDVVADHDAAGEGSLSGMGIQAAGVVTRVGSTAASKFSVADRVTGISLDGAIKTHARTPAGLLAKISDKVMWTQAAQIPMAYFTACAVIQYMGVGDSGDIMLIHRAAASAAGLAAVQVARSNGAKILATVANAQERKVLQEVGGLLVDNILELDHQTILSTIVKSKTGNRGVDMVIDSLLQSDMDHATNLVDCLAPFGRFVSLGQGPLPGISGRRNICLERFNGAEMMALDYVKSQRIFLRAARFILDQPLAANAQVPVYKFSKASEALAQLGKCEDAIVLEPHEEDIVRVVASKQTNTSSTSTFNPDASYIVVGGLGGLGRSVSRWMASKGARSLILISRKGAVTFEAKELVAELQDLGVKVATPACDATDKVALRNALDECSANTPPIIGVIQCSMVLKDKRFFEMSLDEWNAAVRPKMDASVNIYEALDTASLDFFIMLSSTVGLTGTAEQANYAAGGTFQDAFARSLTASQIDNSGPAVVSLDLPVILDVGFVAEKPELMSQLKAAGWAYMEEEEFHATLGYHCFQKKHPDLPASILRSQVAPRLWLAQDTADEGTEPPTWVRDPLFSHMRPNTAEATANGGGGGGSGDAGNKEMKHAALLAAATTAGDAEAVVLDALLAKLSRVLSVELSDLDPACPLSRYGVDSLVAVSLRAWIGKELGAELSVFEMTDKPSIRALAAAVAGRS